MDTLTVHVRFSITATKKKLSYCNENNASAMHFFVTRFLFITVNAHNLRRHITYNACIYVIHVSVRQQRTTIIKLQ